VVKRPTPNKPEEKAAVEWSADKQTPYTLKTPVFEIASVLKYIRVEIFVLHNGKFV
jgi:hypothetical protein